MQLEALVKEHQTGTEASSLRLSGVRGSGSGSATLKQKSIQVVFELNLIFILGGKNVGAVKYYIVKA